MEPCQMFEEFASNVKKIVASKDNDREYGVEWMKKFEESEHVFTTCCRILSSSLGDDVKRHAVKLLRSKIAKTSASFDENGALDLYRELISTLETSPSIEIGTQVPLTTIEVCRMMTRVIPPEHVMESNIIMRIHQIIQEMDTEDPGYIRALVKYLVSSVSVFEPLINGETCSSYGLGLRIVWDLQIFLESAIKRNDRELYCEIFFDETLKALAVSNTGQNENLFDVKDEFLAVFRNSIRKCLQTAFKLKSPQPYLEILLSSIRTDPNDFSKLEPGIFYASSMLNNPKFAVDCHEVVKLILNIPPDAPVTLIKTCCEFLRDFIENCDVAENSSLTREISFDSIYQWLATVPDPASETLKRDREPRKDVLSDNISDCKYINNILVRCRESDHVERLAKLIGDVIRNTHENDAIEVLRGVLDFYKDPVYHQIENNSDRSESARITIFHMTALSIILNNTGDVNVNWDQYSRGSRLPKHLGDTYWGLSNQVIKFIPRKRNRTASFGAGFEIIITLYIDCDF
ncbi:hypothetical protein RF11_13451 [Thelohanellus kitauei]|uniref:Uncharacterized protein n=1 Tax=Thelohanellus kitauei TaxID=669202 RepID=A0A0C2M016_THEKT|nr:hypothetical protein RF11_13451 [Thelohanellus kitauei]